MFTPGLAIFHLATILRFSHVCGVWSRVWRKDRFLEHSICRWQHAGAWVLERRHWSSIATAGQHGQSQSSLSTRVSPSVPRSYRTLADHGNVPRSTLHHRARGRRSMEEKAQSQQYLTSWEEDVLIKYLLQMSDLGQSVRIKFIPALAFRVTCQRPTTDRPLKPLSRNWTSLLDISMWARGSSQSALYLLISCPFQ
jgi:hypothetical protein